MAGKKKRQHPDPAVGSESSTPPVDGGGDEKKGPPSAPFAVIGMVASAGGLEAFKKFFAAMPTEASGLAFIVVPHLDPTHESLMVELLAKYTAMTVVEVVDGAVLAPDHVYVIPPNKYLLVEEGKLRLTGPVERSGIAIDRFLRSLADDRREQAVGIILSGTGAHGTLGLKAIKEAGGMVMVQEPTTSAYDRMPFHAVATGLADFVLPPEAMPSALLRFVQAHGHDGGTSAANRHAEEVGRILALIRARSKFDFRGYRKNMAIRRIERRMHLNQLADLPQYLAHLREHPEEVRRLIKDLLISVTSFFRDPEAYHLLRTEVVVPLIQHKDGHAPVRVWVPGCATGEEAYSIAMLLLEERTAAHQHYPVQIFATDLDEDALNFARQGIYPESIADDVSAERLQRFFTKVGEQTYQVTKELRECVVFAAQNLVSEAPFSKLDLISCRNLFIYLETEVQKKLLALFHFALVPEGYLLLGPSESAGPDENLFVPLSKKWRLFRRSGAARPGRIETFVPLFPHLGGDRARGEERLGRGISYADLAQRVLLEDFAPATVLVNARHEILYLLGPTARYLNLPRGEPALNVLEMARVGLRTKLRGALVRAGQTHEPCVVTDLRIKRQDAYYPIQITVKPVQHPRAGAGLYLVVFEERLAPASASTLEPAQIDEEGQVRQLEYELRTNREELQGTIEQLESTNEEMKAANEEMMSMNEELQSANEELETSKEELQSLNEELSTVNHQLQDKVQEVEETNNDLSNLLNATDLATVFLDRQSRIKRFTPASRLLFNLIGADLGRSIGDITQKFADPTLLEAIAAVLGERESAEKEVCTVDERWYTRRVLPYRTRDGRIEGAVLTFADVTELKRAELALRQDKELRRLATVLLDSNDAIIVQDFQGEIMAWNAAATRMYGYSENDALKMNMAQLIPQEQHDRYEALIVRVRRHGRAGPFEVQRRTATGALLDVSLNLTLLREEQGDSAAIATTERNITQRKSLEKEVLEIAAMEQRRIGQELHDSTGQELTALALVAESLAEALKEASSPDAELAEKIAGGVKGVLGQVRSLSRGLIPVEVDAHGLSAALRTLAGRISDLQHIPCTFEEDCVVLLEDHQVATHLYRIAQEAIANALKHSQAQHLSIRLGLNGNRVALRIRDDGTGLPEPLPEGEGMGLRIMQYRAELIHARLEVAPAPNGGTQVTCTLLKEIDHA